MPQFLLILVSVFLLDVLTKMLVRKEMLLGQEISLLPFFSLTHIENTGVAFGLFAGRNYFFIFFGLIMIFVIGLWARQLYTEDKFSCYVLAMVLGGAYGNLTDRIFFGKVTDFLDFFIGSHHWPAFNVADSAICVGAGLLIWRSVCSRSS